MKIIKAYDAKMAKEGKMNKAQFAANLGIARSSLSTILGDKTRQSMETADNEGKAIHRRKRIKTSPYDEIYNCLTIWFKQKIAKHVHISGDIL